MQQTSDFFKVSFRVARVQLIFVIAAAIDQRIKQDNSVEIRESFVNFLEKVFQIQPAKTRIISSILKAQEAGNIINKLMKMKFLT